MTNLDRFSQGLRDPQDVEPVSTCPVCKEEIYPGETVHVLPDGTKLCSKHQCVLDFFHVQELTIDEYGEAA